MRPQKSSSAQLMRRRNFLKITGIGSSTGLLAGCLGEENGDDNLLIGGLQPYSGPFATEAELFEQGLEFALEEINNDNGVLNRQLTFEGIDTEASANEATSIARQFVQRDNAIALTGPVSSDAGIAAANAAEDLEVPLIFNQVGSHAAISRDSRYTYRLGLLPAPTIAQAQAEFIETEGYEEIGVIIADYAYGRAFETGIEEFFPENINLTMRVAPFDETDFTPFLREMPQNLDVLITTSHPPGAYNIFRQMRELGIEPDIVPGISDAAPSFNAIGEEITEGFASVHQPDVYTDRYREVAQRFYDQTNGYFGLLPAIGYVAGQLIATGIEEAGEEDRVEVSNAIREIELDTLFAEPLQYTDWGELDNVRQIISGFETEAPDYYPEGEFNLVEIYRTEPLEGYDPEEIPVD